MSLSRSLYQMVEEIRDLAEKANAEEAKSAMTYCIKQLKISAIARSKSAEEEEESDEED